MINIFISFAKSKTIVLMGPTRAGKSCFINMITGQKIAEVGDDSGDSTTKISNIFTRLIDGFPINDRIYNLIDTMGFEDSEKGSFGDSISLTNSTLSILKHLKNEGQLNAILLFESLNNDSNTLEKSLKKLIATFGKDIVKSIIVIINKQFDINKKRLDILLKVINSYLGLQYIHWKTGCGSNLENIYYEQIFELNQKINRSQRLSYKYFYDLVETLKNEGIKTLKMEKKSTGNSSFFTNVVDIINNIPSYVLSSAEEIYNNMILSDETKIQNAINKRIKDKFNYKKNDL